MIDFPFYLDNPTVEQPRPPHRFPVSGWVWIDPNKGEVLTVEAWVDDQCVGRTRHLFLRPDVCAHLGLAEGTRTGFQFYGSVGAAMALGREHLPLRIVLRVKAETGVESIEAAQVQLPLLPDERDELPYGFLLDPATAAVSHRDGIYGSGPSTRTCDSECLAMVLRFLHGDIRRVLDVGCGLGAFAEPLQTAGYEWLGVEVKTEDCAEMTRRGLPHRQIVPGEPLPFADGEFDAAICLEVLEHIEDTAFFLREIARVTKTRAVFSVPNSELVPLLSPLRCAPWHMMEGDHKNFFTRFNLRELLRESFAWVEVVDYRLHPLGYLRNQELPYHLLAVADRA